jgi:hypothetical protein
VGIESVASGPAIEAVSYRSVVFQPCEELYEMKNTRDGRAVGFSESNRLQSTGIVSASSGTMPFTLCSGPLRTREPRSESESRRLCVVASLGRKRSHPLDLST